MTSDIIDEPCERIGSMSLIGGVVVGIPTFRRPVGLERALRSVATQKVDFPVNVIVADNEGLVGDGHKVVERLKDEGYPFSLSVISVPERGISAARNALTSAFCESDCCSYLAMMDDDQEAESNWLSALVAMAEKTRAECIASAVLPAFEESLPKWALGARIFQRDTTTDGEVPIIYATCGVLLASSVFRVMGSQPFDTYFSVIGGGDTDFFMRCQKAGLKFARASSSRIYEIYPDSRVKISWVLRRSFRGGQGWTRLRMKYEPGVLTVASEILRIAAQVTIGFFKAMVFVWDPVRRVDAICLLAQQTGRVSGFMGGTMREYVKVHGR